MLPTLRERGTHPDRLAAMATTEHSLSTLRSAGLETIDPVIAELVGREADRQRDQLELIASENFTWPAVMEAVGSMLTNKYAEGYPGKRYYGGCEVVDEVERIAIERAKALFGAEYANVQPHAGAQANMAAYHAVLDIGDTVLGLRLDHGGHLTHGHRVNFSGRNYRFVSYGVTPETERIDLDEVRRLAQEHRPRLIVTGASAYPRVIDFAAFREIADEVDALFMVDMAHISGLVAAGLHPNPVEWADIVTSTTHKTLAGPRSGFVLSRADLGPKIDSAVFPGLQGGPLCHATAAKAVCFAVAGTEAFRDYQRQVRTNADALAETLLAGGHRLVSGGTDTHLVLLNLRGSQWSGRDAEDRMHAIGLTANRNAVPFDERPPAVSSGVRIGTPAATMRGLDADDFREVGRTICDVLEPDADLPALSARVDALLARRPLYAGLRGYPTYDGI
jgi:glycine hydroxymethyltransferase